MEQNKDNYTITDIIDIISNKIKGFFILVINSILCLLNFSLKNKYKILIITCSSICLGILYFMFSKPIYKTNGIIELYGVQSTDVVPIIDEIPNLDKQNLTDLFKIRKEIAKEIIDVKGFYFIDQNRDYNADYIDYKNKVNLSDTTVKRIENRINIMLKISDKNVITEIEKGIINYIQNNYYFNIRNNIRISRLKELISQTEEEVIKLDSLQRNDYFIYRYHKNQPTSGQFFIINEKDIKIYHYELLELKSKLNYYKNEFNNYKNPAIFVKPFYLPEIPINNLPFILKLSFVIGLFVSYIILFFWNKYLEKK